MRCADDQPAQGASGNRQGAIYPLLNHRHYALAQFYAGAFPYVLRCYQQLAAQGVVFEHQWCGVTQLAWDEKSAGKIAHILGAGALHLAERQGLQTRYRQQLPGRKLINAATPARTIVKTNSSIICSDCGIACRTRPGWRRWISAADRRVAAPAARSAIICRW